MRGRPVSGSRRASATRAAGSAGKRKRGSYATRRLASHYTGYGYRAGALGTGGRGCSGVLLGLLGSVAWLAIRLAMLAYRAR